MVVALGPGKFYGSSLPRPRFYTEVKFNDERIDPPPPVMDPLMEWAQEAHWSMGGLCFKRLRLQGRIEGKIDRLRVQKEQIFKKSPKSLRKLADSVVDEDESESEVEKSPSPPPAPVAIKRRRVVGLIDEEEEEVVAKRGLVRKLGDDFERVARESGMASDSGGETGGAAAAGMKKGKKLVKGGRKIGAGLVAAAAGIRSSPRLKKRC